MEDHQVDVPSYFLCPISLEMMKDPVTVSTGITYDRESIERWLSSSRNPTCPVTKQLISSDCDLMMTPNHTLRRLIQSWCTLNATHGVQRIPTPKAPISKAQVAKIIDSAKSSPQARVTCLKRLRSIASHGDRNKRCMEAAGAVEFLSSIISETATDETSSNDCSTSEIRMAPRDEALSLLYSLRVSEAALRSLITNKFIDSLLRIMQGENYESRAYALMLLESVIEVTEPVQIASLASTEQGLFIEVVRALHECISEKATKAALKLLNRLSPPGRNRIRAVEARAVPVLIELLLEHSSPDQKRVCEMTLTALDILCQCAEGRAEFLNHAAGLAVVSKKILRVSQIASDRAVRVLLSVSKFSAKPRVLEEMLHLGVVAKLCLILQVDCGSKTKEKAAEILKMHARTWKNSSCVPSTLASSYPC